MKYVHVLAEGQTEVSFIKQVLCGYFLEHGLVLDSRAVETSRDSRRVYRGGVTSYAKAQADLKRWIKERPGDYFTSMFDFYRLPPDFPGMSHNAASDLQKVKHIESAFASDIGCHRFIPYIQMHEFEALLFTDITFLKGELFGKDTAIEALSDETKHLLPEDINNGPTSSPSKRILSKLPNYDKVVNGVSVTKAIGVDALCNACPHFKEWIEALKTLAF